MLIALNDPNLPPMMHKNAGKFRCLLGITEILSYQSLNKEKIMKIYHIASNMPNVMDKQCHCFHDDYRIIRMGFLSMHNKRSFARQVGYINYQEEFLENDDEKSEEEEISALPYIETKFDFAIKEWQAEDGHIYATLFDHNNREISCFWNDAFGPMPALTNWQNCTYYRVFL